MDDEEEMNKAGDTDEEMNVEEEEKRHSIKISLDIDKPHLSEDRLFQLMIDIFESNYDTIVYSDSVSMRITYFIDDNAYSTMISRDILRELHAYKKSAHHYDLVLAGLLIRNPFKRFKAYLDSIDCDSISKELQYEIDLYEESHL